MVKFQGSKCELSRRDVIFKGIVAAGASVMASTVAAEPKGQGFIFYFICLCMYLFLVLAFFKECLYKWDMIYRLFCMIVSGLWWYVVVNV